ncbi:unnamed protein product [Caenorhabditis bovis]|uniref:Uncharacterized protein n=1 Tax=Caenorhabditis bovis TaxID=2654633 RepID=A0A8S1EFC5_9PELO|nr:unnamed protein product [Caenorhabditis bovis]
MHLIFLVTVATVVAKNSREDNNRGLEWKSVESSNEVSLYGRGKRQVYYLCGYFPNQYLSFSPCNNNCNTCNCQVSCSTTIYCQQFNSNWKCMSGCCRIPYNDPTLPPPVTTTTPSNPVAPLCGGRETSGGYCRAGRLCGSGYLCTDNNVCCRCAYSTSIGPCVNGKCPENTYCSPTNNCCPYLVK